jgi:uncharacterized membrane protein (UPF0127 family)
MRSCTSVRLVAVAVALIVVAAGCGRGAGPAIPTEPPGGALVAFGSHIVAVELAIDETQWEHGLMDRKTLGANSGMLFLFPKPSASPFYMYRTLIPLSVAFLRRTRGQRYRVLEILDMTPCRSTDPGRCRLYDPKTTYDAALEVNLGWFARSGVHPGSQAQVGRAPTAK